MFGLFCPEPVSPVTTSVKVVNKMKPQAFSVLPGTKCLWRSTQVLAWRRVKQAQLKALWMGRVLGKGEKRGRGFRVSPPPPRHPPLVPTHRTSLSGS